MQPTHTTGRAPHTARWPGRTKKIRMRPYGPLRGRDHELSTALAVIRRTRTHGASGVVLIPGNAGVGKTALLSEICRQAANMNIRLARSKCDEIEQAWRENLQIA